MLLVVFLSLFSILKKIEKLSFGYAHCHKQKFLTHQNLPPPMGSIFVEAPSSSEFSKNVFIFFNVAATPLTEGMSFGIEAAAASFSKHVCMFSNVAATFLIKRVSFNIEAVAASLLKSVCIFSQCSGHISEKENVYFC
jgi:hypothetical protein